MTAQAAHVVAAPAGTDDPSLSVPRRRRPRPGRTIVDVVLVLGALLWLVPVYWMLKSAFQRESDLLSSSPDLLPWSPTLENFSGVLNSPAFWGGVPMFLVKRRGASLARY